jgi:hypothetical protein
VNAVRHLNRLRNKAEALDFLETGGDRIGLLRERPDQKQVKHRPL